MDQRYDVIIKPLDETNIIVYGNPGCEMEISSNYTFTVPDFYRIKNNKNLKGRYKHWDGKVRLFNRKTKLFPKGLLTELLFFLEASDYKVQNNIIVEDLFKDSNKELETFLLNNKLPHILHDYQKNSILLALKERRGIHICGTGGGKSLIIYSVARIVPDKVLIVVPTLSLVHQLKSDFTEYSAENNFDCDKDIQKIYAGQSKDIISKITISTWQSLQKEPAEFFKQFSTLIIDECHTASGKQLKSIIEKCNNIKNRYGFTGTLQKWQCTKLQLYGLIGKINVIKTAKDLIEDGFLAPLKINCLVLKYKEAIRKQRIQEGWNYEDELQYLFECRKRTDLIAKLACKSNKKCLITFRRVKAQGDVIYKRIMELNPNKAVYYITGHVDGAEREEMRKKAEEDENCIIIATESIFSTGVNIKSLDVLIFACPSKAQIRIIQSLGRILRKSNTTEFAEVWDLVDDISWKSSRNYALESYIERADIYLKERHKFNIKEIEF